MPQDHAVCVVHRHIIAQLAVSRALLVTICPECARILRVPMTIAHRPLSALLADRHMPWIGGGEKGPATQVGGVGNKPARPGCASRQPALHLRLVGPGLLVVPAPAAQAAGPASILAWASTRPSWTASLTVARSRHLHRQREPVEDPNDSNRPLARYSDW